jgi:Na+/H+-translocating membrane pyrophosphatase
LTIFLLVRAAGVFSSIIGIWAVRCGEMKDPMRPISNGFIIAGVAPS